MTMSYNAALETLHSSIISGDPTAAEPIVRPKTRMTAKEQIAIYSDAYKIRLRHAVRSDYPCLATILGDVATNKLVNAYVEATPSLSYNLDFYPFGFWRFVQNNSTQPEICELAELEGAIAECFMGTGSEPLTAQNLPPLDTETLGRMKFHLRAPFRLLRFTHDAESTMASFKRGKTITAIAPNPIYLLVYRHNNEVQRRILESGEYHLLNAIQQTENFNQAIQQAQIAAGEDENTMASNVMRWLPRWITEAFLALPST
jgi:hypothetical protein